MSKVRYVKTKSARIVLGFLQERTFSHLPSEMWNHRLWLYRDLIPSLNQAISSQNENSIDINLALSDQEIFGASVSVSDGKWCRVTATNDEIEQQMLSICMNSGKRYQTIEIGFPKRSVAQIVSDIETSMYVYNGGTRHYWCSNVPITSVGLRDNEFLELQPQDAKLYDEVKWADGTIGWPELADLIQSGVRYFAVLENGNIISQCGLCRTSVHTNEVIAVGTLINEYKRKGYAEYCCANAMEKGLNECLYCTWTCDRDNEGSNKLSEKLGMQLAYETVRFKNVVAE